MDPASGSGSASDPTADPTSATGSGGISLRWGLGLVVGPGEAAGVSSTGWGGLCDGVVSQSMRSTLLGGG